MNQEIKLKDSIPLLIVLGMLILFGLSSCVTEKKVSRYLNDNKGFAANICDSLFPVLNSTDTVYVSPPNDIIQAYEEQSLFYSNLVDSLLSRKCPESKQQIKEILKDRPCPPAGQTVVNNNRESTARLEAERIKWSREKAALTKEFDQEKKQLEMRLSALQDEKDQLQSDYDVAIEGKRKAEADARKAKKQRNRLFWWLVAAVAVIFRKPLIKGTGMDLKFIRKSIFKI